MIDSEYFFSIIQKDIFIIIELKFDRKYLNDIKLICNTSKYSNVSEQFCKAMEPVNYSVPVISQSIVRYIVTKNIPLGIVKKSDKLREYLEKFLSVSSNEKIGDNIELYINFDPKREFISSENLDSLHKFSIFDIKL